MDNNQPYHTKTPYPRTIGVQATAFCPRHAFPDRENLSYGIFVVFSPRSPVSLSIHSSFFIHHSSLSYTFSAKECDSETGLSYFGSRYYSSDLSVWLSVDPMSDKYPSLSPYTYCANNPVRVVDPDGEEIWIPDDPPKKNVLTSVKNTIQNVGAQIEAGLHQLDLKVTGTAENRFCEGNSDGANQGTITKRDVVVGMAAVATMVTAGAALEAEGAGSAIVSTAAAVNNIDDATVNSTGQTFSQRKTENKPIANAAVNVAKTATPAASIGSSTVTIVKNGVKKASACMADVALSTYSFFKSLIHNKKSNVKP